jgi:hypothetical protein
MPSIAAIIVPGMLGGNDAYAKNPVGRCEPRMFETESSTLCSNILPLCSSIVVSKRRRNVISIAIATGLDREYVPKRSIGRVAGIVDVAGCIWKSLGPPYHCN